MFSNHLLRLLFVVLVVGCGKPSDGRMAISGNVILQGEKLDEGVIEFLPRAGGGRSGPATQTGAVITDGAYNIPREQGLLVGTYKVLLTAGDGKTPADGGLPGPTGNIVSVDRIPPEYNVDSQQEVEVTSEGPNVFDYDIP